MPPKLNVHKMILFTILCKVQIFVLNVDLQMFLSDSYNFICQNNRIRYTQIHHEPLHTRLMNWSQNMLNSIIILVYIRLQWTDLIGLIYQCTLSRSRLQISSSLIATALPYFLEFNKCIYIAVTTLQTLYMWWPWIIASIPSQNLHHSHFVIYMHYNSQILQ